MNTQTASFNLPPSGMFCIGDHAAFKSAGSNQTGTVRGIVRRAAVGLPDQLKIGNGKGQFIVCAAVAKRINP